MKRLAIIIIFCLCMCITDNVMAQQSVLTEKQTSVVACAKEKIFALYNFMNYEKSKASNVFTPSACGTTKKPIEMPKWLEKDLPNMAQNRIVNEQTEDGTYSSVNEAQMWRRVLSRIYEYFTLVENINEGTAYTAEEIMAKFGTLRTQYLIVLDGINANPRFYESLNGHGRQILATLELINQEMLSTGESFVVTPKEWRNKFRKSVVGVAVLSNDLYAEFMREKALPPVPAKMPNKGARDIVLTLLLVIGTLLSFLSVLLFINDRNDKLTLAIQEYLQKSAMWSDDYNRQFIEINIKYIVIGTVIVLSGVGLLMGFAVGGFFGFIIFVVCVGFGLYYGIKMPGVFLDIFKKQRGIKVNKQLMDALILLSNSLKSGMDIVQGFELVSHDLRPPIADEFGLVIKNYSLGTPFERALEGMEDRVESRLLSYMVKAIILQRQVGGNLTKIFERIVENIREESKLEDKLQAMTAQQKIQSIVVGIMPWIMVGVMFIFQPDTMISFYTRPVGVIVLFFCIIWIFIGLKLVKKLGEIKV